MNYRIAFPEKAYFGQKIPKQKIYDFGKASAAVKQHFVKYVEKITWDYKLSPKTTNIPAKDYVQELQVITLHLKGNHLPTSVLQAIDNVIQSPAIFCLRAEYAVQYAATYKRPSESSNSKWVIGEYIKNQWIDINADLKPLPVALDLASLYHMLLKDFSSVSHKRDESITDHLTRTKEAEKLEKKIIQLSKRLQREKQFNRRVEINSQIKELQKELFSIRDR